MKDAKQIIRKLLSPHSGIIALFVIVSAVLLSYTFASGMENDTVGIISYVFSAYTLTVLCMKIPQMYKKASSIKEKNKYINQYINDAHLRLKISLYGSLSVNIAYAVFQLSLGFYHATVWYYALSAYYAMLGIMRFLILKDVTVYKPGKNRRRELYRSRFCGMVLLLMNIALAVIVFYISRQGRGFKHHYITTIAMAVYTFSSLTKAIVNMIGYKKYNSPVMSSAKAINLASAAVSMLTLETAMLTAFGEGNSPVFRRIMTGATGAVVCVFVLLLAIFMIVRSNKEIRNMRKHM